MQAWRFMELVVQGRDCSVAPQSRPLGQDLAHLSSQEHDKTMDRNRRLWRGDPIAAMELVKAAGTGALMSSLQLQPGW